MYDDYNTPLYQQGWVCPKCGAVLAPSQSYCPFCMPKGSSASSNSSSYEIDWTKPTTTTIPLGGTK